MPVKHVPKERAWGTRYDTLDSSPPPSPPKQQDQEPTPPSAIPITSVVASTNDLSRRDRIASHTNTIPPTQSEKMPHDASIFVGSLPTHIEQPKLTSLLHEHLSQHAEVKSIKVVRDSKGGICAFVQCEDSSTAARLIHTLQSLPPRPFMGRMLRYEPARAFRTLLISYRFPVVLYDSEAKIVDPIVLNQNDGSTEQEPLNGAGTFLEPLEFDAETILKIASTFGDVEHFNVYTVTDDKHDGRMALPRQPYPHNVSRASNMDAQIWEVKWHHRDDCVVALTVQCHYSTDISIFINSHLENQALRRIPFISRRTSLEWYKDDLPSLDFDASIFGDTHDSRPWGDREIGGTVSPASPSSPLSVNLSSTPAERGCKTPNDPRFHTTGARTMPSITMPSADPGRGANRLSPTQDSTTASIAPITPGDQPSFLRTPPGLNRVMSSPRSVNGAGLCRMPNQGPNLGQRSDYSLRDASRTVDPTSVFVGGLEMFGPDAWNETKVRAHFEKYGTIEKLQFVSPLNQRTAFAFIKFDVAEAATCAIENEHNCMYNGRQMRVQLRDNNAPPRSQWRPARGRTQLPFAGHLRHHGEPSEYGGQGQYTNSPGHPNEMTAGSTGVSVFPSRAVLPPSVTLPTLQKPSGFSPGPVGKEGSAMSNGSRGPSELPRQWMSESALSSLSSSTTQLSLSQADSSFEQLATVVTSMAPSPSASSIGPSTSVSGSMQHNVMQGYFAPQPWMHAYAPYYPYPIPFVPGYSAFPPPPVQQSGGQPNAADSLNSNAASHHSWPGMHNIYKVPQQGGWASAPLILPTAQAQVQQHQPLYMPSASSSGTLSSAPSFRGSYPGASQAGQRNGVTSTPPPRRLNRRNSYQNNGFSGYRTPNSHASPNRFTRPFGNSAVDVSFG
ncbi:predicted protein [Postia placenta Mad-698-R]|uniref:RRM domain-containing protein n=1 Tax=Postia placenta MAD-698-R-SB12 TaxID=670580 RepID=A0A1X6NE69_9APHY|nr:hypothetical protein POSPLADRAFT_1042186 [Postia placenta MAD-698-R-SB12]EED80497.1 predicted protein [Postia placenta Mad-698-R]OSX66884.1 hypothetical protein POSPLADRAFT_1042186 [Postia placenta MAD-698-R-SB12]